MRSKSDTWGGEGKNARKHARMLLELVWPHSPAGSPGQPSCEHAVPERGPNRRCIRSPPPPLFTPYELLF